MKTNVLVFLLLSLSLKLFGQTFTFSELNSPSPQSKLEYVKLSSANEALIAGPDIRMYYNGSAVSLLPNSPYNAKNFQVSAVEDDDGNIHGACLESQWHIHRWNNTNKTWQAIDGLHPPFFSIWDTYDNYIKVISPDLTFLYQIHNDTSKLFRLDGEEFTLMKKIHIPGKKTWFLYFFCHRDNDDVFALSIIGGVTKLFSCDYDSTFVELGSYPFLFGAFCTFDNENFYIANENILRRWNSTTLEMEVVYSNVSVGDVVPSSFMISNDVIILVGPLGIQKLTISTGQSQFLDTRGFWGTSYSHTLQKAMLVYGNGQIFEMFITDKVNEEEANNAFQIYPVPALNVITLEFPVLAIQDKKAEIFNLLGQLLDVKYFSEFSLEIDISDLNSGVYFVRLSDEKTGQVLSNKKFLKQ